MRRESIGEYKGYKYVLYINKRQDYFTTVVLFTTTIHNYKLDMFPTIYYTDWLAIT